MTSLLGVDVGTTHCKVGLFGLDGSCLGLASRSTPTRYTPHASAYYDPYELYAVIASLIHEVVSGAQPADVAAIGVASMAESGMLHARKDGGANTTMITPWFDRGSAPQITALVERYSPRDLFRRSGLQPSFKYGLIKLLQMRETQGLIKGGVWLSVADWIVYCLTGRMATDPTLAARTYVYDIQRHAWDERWIRELDLDPALFPDVLPSGAPAGTLHPRCAEQTGLPAGTPVAVCGHDHICALLPAGIHEPGVVLDSIGTAEALIGVLARLDVGEKAFCSGLGIVPHILPDTYAWIDGISSAGRSVNWLRAQLAVEPLSDGQLDDLLWEAGTDPTGILFYPYLSGSGLQAAFIGLDVSHSRGHLARAVLEGVAYEAEAILQSARDLTGRPITEAIAVGGGSRNRHWMQIRADVSGCRYSIPRIEEATALGAALAAGLGSGALAGKDEIEAIARRLQEEGTCAIPDTRRHRLYRLIFGDAYAGMDFEATLGRHANFVTSLDKARNRVLNNSRGSMRDSV